MRISGSVEVQVIDGNTGKIKQTIKKKNLIPDSTLTTLLTWNTVAGFFTSRRISISAQQTTPTPTNATLNQVLATGSVATGVTSPTWNETVDPPFGQIQNQIAPTGTARDFWTIGLTTLAANNAHPANTTATANAYLKLDTVCTQGANDFLNIFYRIQFDSAGNQGLIDRARYDFGRRLFGVNNSSFRMSYLYSSANRLTTVTGLIATSMEEVASFIDGSGVLSVWNTVKSKAVNNHFKWKYVLELSKSQLNGQIFCTLGQGINENNQIYSITPFVYDKEPFQTGFWHSSSATGPFFDSATAGSSNGMIYLGGTWTGTTPQLYRITITTSGATGVAQYRFSVATHNGLNGNTFRNRQNTLLTFTDYGWNGSAWVAGTTTPKLTHTTADVLLNGLTIRFENGANAPHFTATDYFTQSVNLGLLKDNATDVYFESQWYSVPAQFDSTFSGTIPAVAPYTLTLPAASDPNFIRLETDSPDLHKFRIGGNPVLSVYNDNSPPGPQEVSLDSSGSGLLLFNAADAGKPFVADAYAWIKR